MSKFKLLEIRLKRFKPTFFYHAFQESEMERQRELNLKQNQKLSELRDWLLPMLMNGQVTVGEVERELGMFAEEGENYKS